MTRSVAIWLRDSSEDQKLDSQRDAVERYVQARGWNVTARFIEQGVGGAAQYRKVVDEILENARRRRFDAVVIFRGDRSFRTASKGCPFIDELISIGCAFLSIEGRYRHVDTRGRAGGEDGDPDGRVGAQGDPGARAPASTPLGAAASTSADRGE